MILRLIIGSFINYTRSDFHIELLENLEIILESYVMLDWDESYLAGIRDIFRFYWEELFSLT